MTGFPLPPPTPRNQRRIARSSAVLVCVLIATGLAWIAFGQFLDPDDFTDPLRRWRHRMLVAHGLAAYLFLWLAGTLLPLHQAPGWSTRSRRSSGVVFAALLLSLAVSGLLLYYPPADDARDALSTMHQWIGIAVVPALFWHALVRRRR